MAGYQFQEIPVYSILVDDETKYGSSAGLLRRPFAGGLWDYGLYCGSRSISCGGFSSFESLAKATRGCSYKS
jgi:hypothetical protein